VYSSLFENVYSGKTVLVSGHTGFKGSWLSTWLLDLGAHVIGISSSVEPEYFLFRHSDLEQQIQHELVDIRDKKRIMQTIQKFKPDFIFHMAAQPLVRESYKTPLETFDTNVMGTANLLESCRIVNYPCTVVVITTDKCYENKETGQAYTENDPLGGHDPYSASKACAEIVTSAYRSSFFAAASKPHNIRVATVRAGNVIGPGDMAADRIIPDCIRALAADKEIDVRNPNAVRPWQLVLEPLAGYMWLAARMSQTGDSAYESAWNFGPSISDNQSVGNLVELLVKVWGSGSYCTPEQIDAPHEANLLSLDIEKAKEKLKWKPILDFKQTISWTVNGYRRLFDHQQNPEAFFQTMLDIIQDYTKAAVDNSLMWSSQKSSKIAKDS
jgi:CDP-glucose 4,6-dehydratase